MVAQTRNEHLRWQPLCMTLRPRQILLPHLHMNRRLLFFVLAPLLAPLALQAQTPSPTPTVDELVAKNLKAKGGEAALKAIHTIRFEGRLLVNNGQMQLTYTQVKKRPDKVRTNAVLQGMTLVQAYNGNSGWKVFPFQGRKDPEKMSGDEAKSLVEDAEIGGPLEDWKAQGKTLSYLGTEDIDGTPAYKLKVERKNGDISYVYLDPDYYLEIRIDDQRTEQGARVEVQSDFGDYEKVDGVYFPFSIESGPKGSTDKQQVIVDKAEANIPVDDAIFDFPATAAK
ncbi:MAG TPA: hypothetical protein VII74_05750 [Chthoniobacterales bacterium]